jgi:NlpC/P60 family
MKMYRILLLLFIVIITQSCQKNIQEDLNGPLEEYQSQANSQTERIANQSPYYWANRSVQEVLPENNTYVHGVGSLTWAGVNGATTSTCSTDCSGFLNHLYTQTYSYTSTDYQSWMGTSRPKALNYYNAIQAQKNFTKISKITLMQQGDIIAIKYPVDNDNSGHVMMMVTPPVVRIATAPLVSGTTQYEVSIIDCSSSGHGPTDTRYISSGNFVQGVGKGICRFYLNKKGAITGYTWSTYSSSVYYSQSERPLNVGRHIPLN